MNVACSTMLNDIYDILITQNEKERKIDGFSCCARIVRIFKIVQKYIVEKRKKFTREQELLRNGAV